MFKQTYINSLEYNLINILMLLILFCLLKLSYFIDIITLKFIFFSNRNGKRSVIIHLIMHSNGSFYIFHLLFNYFFYYENFICSIHDYLIINR